MSKSKNGSIKIITPPEEVAAIKKQAEKFHVVIDNNLIKAGCPSINDPLSKIQDVPLILTTEYDKAEINIHYQCKKALEVMSMYGKKGFVFKDEFLELDIRGRVMFLEIVKKQDYLKDSILSVITPYMSEGLEMEAIDCYFGPSGSFVAIEEIFNTLIFPTIKPYLILDDESVYMPEDGIDVSSKEGKKQEPLKITVSESSKSSSTDSSSFSSSCSTTTSSTSTTPLSTSLSGDLEEVT